MFGAQELEPCEFEDSTNCYWFAEEAGNGKGQSFVDVNGTAYAIDLGAVEHTYEVIPTGVDFLPGEAAETGEPEPLTAIFLGTCLVTLAVMLIFNPRNKRRN